MNYDLHMDRDTIQPLTKAGIDYLHSVLSRGPIFPSRDYQEATARGLHVSFEDKDTLERVIDWKPMEQPVNTGYADDCEADDNPDERLCDDINSDNEIDVGRIRDAR
jgi:hypothetical protein